MLLCLQTSSELALVSEYSVLGLKPQILRIGRLATQTEVCLRPYKRRCKKSMVFAQFCMLVRVCMHSVTLLGANILNFG